MKLLVLSDSHRRKNRLSEIISEHKDAQAIVFLGDGISDFEDALAENAIDPCDMSRDIISVLGNCDAFGRSAGHIVRELGGIRFYITHGAEENVKLGLWSLLEAAKNNDCKAALYGHTHIASCIEKNGVSLFNPGAVANGEYGIIQISTDGAMKFSLKP